MSSGPAQSSGKIADSANFRKAEITSPGELADCPKGYVCGWTGENFTGDKYYSRPYPNYCATGLPDGVTLHSVWNCTNYQMTFYGTKDCSEPPSLDLKIGKKISSSPFPIITSRWNGYIDETPYIDRVEPDEGKINNTIEIGGIHLEQTSAALFLIHRTNDVKMSPITDHHGGSTRVTTTVPEGLDQGFADVWLAGGPQGPSNRQPFRVKKD